MTLGLTAINMRDHHQRHRNHPIDDRGPEQRANRIHAYKIQRQPNQRSDRQHSIKLPCLARPAFQTRPPLKCLRNSVRGRTSKHRDRQQTGADNTNGKQLKRKAPRQRFQGFAA